MYVKILKTGVIVFICHNNVTDKHNNVTDKHNNVTDIHNNVTDKNNNVTDKNNNVANHSSVECNIQILIFLMICGV
jgi:hypothetical protein